jgi:hypothetical protein
MNRQRLKKLADHLRKLSRRQSGRQFDMNAWFVVDTDTDEEATPPPTQRTIDPLTGVVRDEFKCRTAACALGEACTIPSFRKGGLTLREDRYVSGYFTPGFKSYRGTAAGAMFFGISMPESDWLFLPENYSSEHITPKMVAKRIDQLLAGEGPR